MALFTLGFYGGTLRRDCTLRAQLYGSSWEKKFFVRLAIALAGFFYLMQFGWIAVISGLVGFTLARLLLIQKLKPDQGNSQRPTTEASALQNQYASAPEESDRAEGRGNAP
ncbi:MAG: hypothetical protein KDK33_12855 [Leptospiraceae bacterium]|nr:hypothetical protein [Leptospiraceae bacterium]